MATLPTDCSQERIRREIVKRVATLCGTARYTWLSEDCDPPRVVNCLMAIRWVWAPFNNEVASLQPGPTLFRDLLYAGQRASMAEGNVIFSRNDSAWVYSDNDRGQGGVNHAGILTEICSVIHASRSENTVVCSPLLVFCGGDIKNLRGIYSLFPP